jgi:hypothetical protein
MFGIVHTPVVSVTTVRVNVVSVCVAVTVAPGRAAPLSSATRPLSCAVACAQAESAVRKVAASAALIVMTERPLNTRGMMASR